MRVSGATTLRTVLLLVTGASIGILGFWFGTRRAGSQAGPGSYVPLQGASVLYVARPTFSPAGRGPTSAPAIGRTDGFLAGAVEIDALWQRDISTHAALLGRPQFLMQMLLNEASDVRRTQWFKSYKGDDVGAMGWLEKNVRIQVIPGTALIEVSVVVPGSPRDSQVIAHEIASQYLQTLREQNLLSIQLRTAQLEQLRTSCEAELQGTESRCQVLDLSAQRAEPADRSRLDRRLDAMRQDLKRLRERRAQLKEQIDALHAEEGNVSSDPVFWR